MQGASTSGILEEGLVLSADVTVTGPPRVETNGFLRAYTGSLTDITGSTILTTQDTTGVATNGHLIVDRESGGAGRLDADSSLTNNGTFEIRTTAFDAVSIAGDFANNGTFSGTSGAVTESADAVVPLDGGEAQI